jgi:hypothetical protein
MKHIVKPQVLETVITSEKENSGAEFTIKSLTTGKDYTYKIARKKYNNKWYTYVSVERGYLEYLYLGFYANGNIYNKKGINKSDASIAITWVLNKIIEQKFDLLNRTIEICHLGKCIKCGLTLTDSLSISIGLGPVCRK